MKNCSICGHPIEGRVAMRVIAGALFGDKRWWTCHENCGNNLINIFRELGVWQDFQLIKTEEIR